MTMIAIQEHETFPVLFGDLLFSSNFEKEFIYPSYNVKFNLPMNGGRHPYRMIQKTYIVHPLISVVVAGDYGLILKFINCIKDYFKSHEATLSNLDSFINSYVISPAEEAYGICIADPHKSEFQYRYLGNWKEKGYKSIGKLYTVGSGSSDILKLFDDFDNVGNFVPLNTYSNAIANICMIFSMVLGDERYYGNDVKNAWGSGMEIVVYDYSEQQFVKLGNINYIIWRCKYSICEEKLMLEPLSIMTYQYIGEILSITSHHGVEPTMYIILPIYVDKADFDCSQIPTEIPIEANRICNIFQIEIEEKNIIYSFCAFIEDNTEMQTIFLKYENNSFKLYCKTSFNESLEAIVKGWISNNIK